MNLEARIERLEKQNRWLKRIGFMLVMLAGVGVSMGFQDQQDLVKQLQARHRVNILNQITIGKDTPEMMQNLIQSAKNGDHQAARILLGIMFSELDKE